jgi:hypothetical protein
VRPPGSTPAAVRHPGPAPPARTVPLAPTTRPDPALDAGGRLPNCRLRTTIAGRHHRLTPATGHHRAMPDGSYPTAFTPPQIPTATPPDESTAGYFPHRHCRPPKLLEIEISAAQPPPRAYK